MSFSFEAQFTGRANPSKTFYIIDECLELFFANSKSSKNKYSIAYVVKYANHAYLYITICCCASIYHIMHYFQKETYWKNSLMTAYNTNTQFKIIHLFLDQLAMALLPSTNSEPESWIDREV